MSTFSSFVQDLFFQYPWNNFLHKEIEACVGAALNSSTPRPSNDQTTTTVTDQSTASETSEETITGSSEESTDTNPKSLRHHVSVCVCVCVYNMFILSTTVHTCTYM